MILLIKRKVDNMGNNGSLKYLGLGVGLIIVMLVVFFLTR